MNNTPETVARQLQGESVLCAEQLCIAPGGCLLRVRSNSPALIASLGDYFSHVKAAAATPDIDIVAIEREEPETGLEFVDWKREPGKTGCFCKANLTGLPPVPACATTTRLSTSSIPST